MIVILFDSNELQLGMRLFIEKSTESIHIDFLFKIYPEHHSIKGVISEIEKLTGLYIHSPQLGYRLLHFHLLRNWHRFFLNIRLWLFHLVILNVSEHSLPAKTASQCEFLSVWRVHAFQRAFIFAFAGFDMVIACCLVTRLTEVGAAPAEPARYVAAILALEVDEVNAMRLTVSSAESLAKSRTHSAN